MYKKCEEILNELEREGKIKISDYQFPEPQELKLRLKDMLEDEVDEKYYLNEKGMNYICGNALNKNLKDAYDREKAFLNKNIAYTINTNPVRRCGDSNYVFDGYGEITIKEFLKIRNATKQGYVEAHDGDSVNLAYPDSKTRRGRVGEQVSQTLTTSDNMAVVVKKKNMLDETKLRRMIIDLKCLEVWLEENNWEDEDKILKYNELQDEILDYLKEVL